MGLVAFYAGLILGALLGFVVLAMLSMVLAEDEELETEEPELRAAPKLIQPH